ncbi:hypothetical protein NAV31_19485 [Pseudomonas stutzeri]|nr:hypothetical protein [Stutzerimonas degradans]
MKPSTISDLRRELEELRPLSEAEIAQQVRDGADAAELLNKQDEIERRRKAIALTLAAAEHRESEALKTEARKEAGRLIAEMEHQRRLAAYALHDCEAAVAALEAAVASFDEEGRKAGLLAAKANQISLLAGLPAPISHPDHNSEIFRDLDGRLRAVMHRRGQIYFNQYRITPEARP